MRAAMMLVAALAVGCGCSSSEHSGATNGESTASQASLEREATAYYEIGRVNMRRLTKEAEQRLGSAPEDTERFATAAKAIIEEDARRGAGRDWDKVVENAKWFAEQFDHKTLDGFLASHPVDLEATSAGPTESPAQQDALSPNELEAARAVRNEVRSLSPHASFGEPKVKQLTTTSRGLGWQVHYGEYPRLTSAQAFKRGDKWNVNLISVEGEPVFRGDNGRWQWLDKAPD